MAVAGVTGTLTLKGSFAEKKASVNNTDPLAVAVSVSVSTNDKYSAGTAADQADTMYGQETTLSAPVTVDLADAARPFGRVRSLMIVVTDPTNPVTVYSTASGGWAGLPPVAEALTIQPGNGHIVLADQSTAGSGNGGLEVTTSPAKFVIDPGGNSVQVSFIVVGCSA